MSEVRQRNNVMKFAFQATQKAVEGADGFTYIKGIASTESKDRHGDIIPMSLWTKEVLDAFMKSPVLLNGHDHSDIAGVVTSLSASEQGLEIEAKVFNEHVQKNGLKTYALIENNALKGFSISFITNKWDDVVKDGNVVWIAKDIELLEISLVAVGANADATFSVQKSLGDDYEQFKAKHSKNNKNMFEKIKSWLSSATDEEKAEVKSLVIDKDVETPENPEVETPEEEEVETPEAVTDETPEATEKSAEQKEIEKLKAEKADLAAKLAKKEAKPVTTEKSGDPNPAKPTDTRSAQEKAWDANAEALKQRKR